jgi:nucleotide-binding universal stress UspA family protein
MADLANSDTLFEHILVPTDFGEPAEHALELALKLAKRCNATVTLLHVYAIPSVSYDTVVAWPSEELARAAQDAMDAALARTKERYAHCQAIVHPGNPWERILTVAKDCGADLIIMGTHGRTGVPRLVLGSVTEKVVRLSPVPVLTVSATTDRAISQQRS